MRAKRKINKIYAKDITECIKKHDFKEFKCNLTTGQCFTGGIYRGVAD